MRVALCEKAALPGPPPLPPPDPIRRWSWKRGGGGGAAAPPPPGGARWTQPGVSPSSHLRTLFSWRESNNRSIETTCWNISCTDTPQSASWNCGLRRTKTLLCTPDDEPRTTSNYQLRKTRTQKNFSRYFQKKTRSRIEPRTTPRLFSSSPPPLLPRSLHPTLQPRCCSETSPPTPISAPSMNNYHDRQSGMTTRTTPALLIQPGSIIASAGEWVGEETW